MKHCIKHLQITLALLGLPAYWSAVAVSTMINSDREPSGGCS